jgi:hypothetical protein
LLYRTGLPLSVFGVQSGYGGQSHVGWGHDEELLDDEELLEDTEELLDDGLDVELVDGLLDDDNDKLDQLLDEELEDELLDVDEEDEVDALELDAMGNTLPLNSPFAQVLTTGQ